VYLYTNFYGNFMHDSENKSFRDNIDGMNPELFRTMFNHYPDALFIHRIDGEIIECNTAAEVVSDYSRKELLEMEMKDIIRDDVFEHIPVVFSGENHERDFSFTGFCEKKGGDRFPAHITVLPLHWNDNTFTFVAVHDVTAQMNLLEEKEQLDHQLRHARKMETLGQLTGEISHYYNNIFTGIIGTLSMARRDVSDEMLSLVDKAEKTANRASGFIRRLLSFSRESHLVKEPVDVGKLIDEVEQFVCDTFDRGIEVVVIKPEPLNTVLADTASLHHVLLNLLTNARDALQEKQHSVSWAPLLRITVEANNVTIDEPVHPDAHKGHYVRISVADTGCGMENETQEQIFKPFFTTKEPGRGTGLGLSAVYSAVKDHGGWIECRSESGNGSTFTLFLPVTTMKKEVSRDHQTTELPCGTETVLLVDDDEMIRSFGTMALERQGYTVLTASNGREGLELFMKECKKIQLILLDLVLPVISGQEVLEKIRRIDPAVKVIITSGHDFSGDRETFAQLKANDYIFKPFNLADLASAVRNVLDS